MTTLCLEKLRSRFLGIDTEYPTADGARQRRVYLDSAATGLVFEPALRVVREFLPHYANTHSRAHHAALISTDVLAWSVRKIHAFLEAPEDDYVVTYCGSGTTAAAQTFAERMARAMPERGLIAASLMEHHSNDLPHRRYGRVLHLPLEASGPRSGVIWTDALQDTLRRHVDQVRYVAVAGASNVTGLVNPIDELAATSHDHGVSIFVDGAQLAPHWPVRLAHDTKSAIDAFAFSGHKLYAPMSPGVLVVRRELFERCPPYAIGGGAVRHVGCDGYELADDMFEREHAGTPNLVGALFLSVVLESLARVGMDRVAAHSRALADYAWQQLEGVRGVRLYGAAGCDATRVAAVAFNVPGMPHALTAAILNDYFGIAVRNDCFCAQPYVRHLLLPELLDMELPRSVEDDEEVVGPYRGMVRASFGCYSIASDVDRLADALRHICAKQNWYRAQYERADAGFVHRTFRPRVGSMFDVELALDQACTTT